MHSALGLILGLALAALGNARVNLGTAATFGIVATTAITSTGLTIVSGDIGISPNGLTSITGSPPGVSTSPPYGADAVAAAAHADAQAAYNAAQALPFTTSLTDQDLGGLTFGPGVYNFASSAQLTGILTLDGQGSPNSVFVFQMGSTITTATAAQVVLINGAKACNVFWQVGSSATLRTATNFIGNILALASITVNSAVTVNGGLYALTAAPRCANTPTSTSTTTVAPTTTIIPGTTLPTTTKPITTAACPTSTVTVSKGFTATVTYTTTKTASAPSTITKTYTTTCTTTKYDTKTLTKSCTPTVKVTTYTTTTTKTATKTASCSPTKGYGYGKRFVGI